MIKIIITFFVLSLFSCNTIQNKLVVLKKNNQPYKTHSQNGLYLSAHYAISKGDVFTASKILNTNLDDTTLLELRFLSDLASGDFKNAVKLSNDKNLLYNLPKFILYIENNDINASLKIAEQYEKFLNFDIITDLINFWLLQSKRKNNAIFNSDEISNQISLQKLLILENFNDIKYLKEIADYNFNLNNYSNNDLLMLAGFYFRLNDKEKFNKIINNNLSDHFDKKLIIKKFSTYKSIFLKKPNLKTILASQIYNVANMNSGQNEKSYTYIKILLEMSLFLCPNMEIAKYSLSELYFTEKSYKIALHKLNSIPNNSFFLLAKNLKKLSIFKIMMAKEKYKKLLFQSYKFWPNNKFLMLEIANYYKKQNNYKKVSKLYKKIITYHGPTHKILYLYAISLDKIGKWNESEILLLNLLKTNPKDGNTLNYLSYSLALRNKNLDMAVNFIKQALYLEPNNAFYLDTLGWVEYKRRNFELSVYYLEQSAILLPRNGEVIDHLGDCYLMLGRLNEAIFEWKKALKHEKNKTNIKLIKEKIKKYE